MKIDVSLGIVVLLLAVLLWFSLGKAVHYPFVNFDDPNVIVENPVIEGMGQGHFRKVFTEVRDHAYLPFYYASFWLDHGIGGKEPRVYHTINLIIHFLCGLALLLTLRRMGGGVFLGGIGAALFLVHPAAVESVVWASGRKDVLSGLLMLLALLLWHSAISGKRRSLCLALSSGLFALAMFTKASVFVLPMIAGLWARLILRENGEQSSNKSFVRKALLVLFGIALVSVGIHLSVASQSGTVNVAQESISSQIPVMLGALSKYFLNMAAPLNLSLVYHRPSGVGMDGLAWGGLLLLGGLAIAAMKFAKKPTVALLGFLCLFIGLIPFNNIFPRFAGVMADRYLYVSLMGLGIFCAGIGLRLQQGMARQVFSALLLVFVLGLAFLSNRRSEVWRDSETLWLDAMDSAPQAILPYLQLGQVYEERAQGESLTKANSLLDEAAVLFAKATSLGKTPRQISKALIKLASLEARRGRYQSALDAFERLDQELPRNLSDAEIEELDHGAVTRASALAGLGRFEDALKVLDRVGVKSSADREARHNRAVVKILMADKKLRAAHSDAGRQAAVDAYNQGLLAYRAIVELWPAYEVARHDYLNAYIPAIWLKDYHIDITKMANALVRDFPKSGRAYYLRARVLKEVDPEGALRDLKTSVQLDPYREEPYLLVVQLLRSTGKNKEAKLVIDKGLASLPDSSRLKSALCETYISFGYHHKNTQRLDYAAEAAARARAIQPDSISAWQLTAEVIQEQAEVARKPSEKKRLWNQANKAFLKLQELDPGNTVALLGRARYHRIKGYAYLYTSLPKNIAKDVRKRQRQEIRRQAMEEFLVATRLAPGAEDLREVKALLDAYASEFRGRAEDLLQINDVPRASVEIEKAIHFAPKSAENQSTLGRILMSSLRFDEAEEAYEACLGFDPENLRALFELGKLRFDRRKFSQALMPLRKFLKVTTGNKSPALADIRKAAMALIETCEKKSKKKDT